LLQAADVTFGYDGRRVIDRLSVRIDDGEIVGVVGPNGSGKTTLFRLISGTIRPHSGRIQLDGVDIISIAGRDRARRLAVVPQETVLTFDYTALELVLMGRYPHLRAFEVEGPDDLAAARAAMEATGTAEFAERAYRTLSGGEKQRVVIASALAQLAGQGPSLTRLLLLDEPTASLDLRYQLEVASLLQRLHQERGITILLSTHDLRLAESVCTRVLLLSHGRILADGPPALVLTAEMIGELFELGAAFHR
jgi:iron complex transport system ATP-binding protein